MTEVSNVFLLAGGLCLVVSGMVLIVCIVLGDRAARLPFDAQQPELHAAALHLRAADWPGVLPPPGLR